MKNDDLNGLRHVHEITDYDRQWFGLYMELHDMKLAGKSWSEIGDITWPAGKPKNYKKLLKENHKRAQWMIATGYKLMIADNPMPRSEQFDLLVASGQMTPEERSVLESPEGAKFWPENLKH